jgi:ELWxxDGT repeat protein
MIRSLLATAALCATTALSAQAPYLVTDLNTAAPSPIGSAPANLRAFNGKVLFQARAAATGLELWQASGEVVSLVKDINPGPYSDGLSANGSFIPSPNGILFQGHTWDTGRELWRTDGTAEGTVLVKDVHPTGTSDIAFRGGVNGRVLFTANDGVHGSEPWVTDGTAEGTRLLIDLDGTSAPTNVSVVATGTERSFLFALNSLWVTDGTPEGTTTSNVGITDPRAAVVIGTTVYFVAKTNATGYELWKSDGTVAGTSIVTELAPGAASGFNPAVARLVSFNDKVYFLANAPGSTTIRDLWMSDGTAAGTQIVKAAIGDSPTAFVSAAGSLLWVRTNELWRSDGTTAGTFLVAPFPTESVFSAFTGWAFVRNNGSSYELWKSDGTSAGTTIVAPLPSWISYPTALDGKLYFTAESAEAGREPWISDGTSAGTRMLANIYEEPASSSAPADLTAAGNLVYFTATDGLMRARQVFRSDGTSSGTRRLTTIGDGYNSPLLSLFTAWNGALYFRELSAQLWKSDGTVAGTTIARHFTEGNPPSLGGLFASTSWLYVTANNTHGSVPWRTDGTHAGTVDLSAARFADPGYPQSFAELAGRVYTAAGIHDPAIFVLGSTGADTRRITRPNFSRTITSLVAGAGLLLFGSRTDALGHELWKSDGTLDGTLLVKDIRTGNASSGPRDLTAVGRHVFFVADDGTHGNELWRTDGTEAGTIRLTDIIANAGTAEPMNLVAVGDLLYFTALNGSGRALWRSDGTAAGTVKVADITANTESWPLYPIDGTLYFAAEDATHGRELWKTTGVDTIAMVADLEPGAGSSSPAQVVRAGNIIYFCAYTRATGSELWAISPTGAAATTISIGDLRVDEGQGGLVVVTRGGNTTGAASVAFTTIDGSAQAGSDYTAVSGTIAFAAGETSKTIVLASLGDTNVEADEAFFIGLSSPAGAVLARTTSTIVIQEDDRRAELKLEWVSSAGGRSVRLTNEGPSTATDVVLRYSESPGREAPSNLECTSTLPSDCTVPPLAAGASVTFDFLLHAEGYTDPQRPPGSTIHVSVDANENDTNAADNTLAKLIAYDGMITLPPFLTVGTPATADIRLLFNVHQDTVVTLSSSHANVAVSTAERVVPAGQATTQFTLTPAAAGSAVLTLQYPQGTLAIDVPVVEPGGTPKLAVAIVADGDVVPYGETAMVSARISAVRPDGTRPTGTVSLLDEAGTVLDTNTIDANAAATFTRTGLAPGSYVHTISYSGDANFKALAGARVFVTVQNWSTSMVVETPPLICGTGDVTVYVRNLDSSSAPTGNVRFRMTNFASGNSAAGVAALAPTGVAGEARAVYRHTFASNDIFVHASYEPVGTFSSTSNAAPLLIGQCVAMNVRATAISPSQVQITWTATGAHHYEVLQAAGFSGFSTVATTSGTSAISMLLSADRAYLYTVRARDEANNVLGYGTPDLATTVMFTNDPLVAGTTPVLGPHIRQAEIAANAVEKFGTHGYAPLLGAKGTPVRAAHIIDLRARINAGRTRLGLPPFAFTGTPVSGTLIRAHHLQELRDAVK